MIYVLRAELLKFLYDLKKYRFNYTMGLIGTFILLTGIYWGAKSLSVSGGNATMFVGIVLWLFASTCISDASNHLFEERYYGTIEQLSITRFSLLQIFMARFFVDLLLSIVEIIVIGIPLFLIFFPGLGVFFAGVKHAIISLMLIIFLILTLYGFGLFLAALGLIFKRVGTFSGILEYLILFFTGIVVPYESMPEVLRIVANILPMGLGIRGLRGLENGVVQWGYVWLSGVYSLLILLIAITIFEKGIRYVKRTGEYSAY